MQLVAFGMRGNNMHKIVVKSALMLISVLAATSSGATLASLYIPSAGGAVRDASFDPRNPNLTPMPAPAATNHYAGLVENPSRPGLFRGGPLIASFGPLTLCTPAHSGPLEWEGTIAKRLTTLGTSDELQ